MNNEGNIMENLNQINTHQALIIIKKDVVILRLSLQRYIIKELISLVTDYLGIEYEPNETNFNIIHENLLTDSVTHIGRILTCRINGQLNGYTEVCMKDGSIIIYVFLYGKCVYYDEDNIRRYYSNNELHRIDRPTPKEKEESYKEWFINGLVHNENGPSIERTCNTSLGRTTRRSWSLYNLLHRENGPAIISDIGKQWHLYGRRYTKKEFDKILGYTLKEDDMIDTHTEQGKNI